MSRKATRQLYTQLPDEHKDIRAGRTYALYMDHDGATVWGPVSLVDARLASYEALTDIVDQHQYNELYWADDPIRNEPLMIDATTAAAMVKVHDALSPEHQDKFEQLIASTRAGFLKMLHFAWDHIELN